MTALVVRLDSFGDVLLAGPAVRAVAAHHEHVALLCGPRGAPAARLLPGVDEVLVWEAPWEGFDPPDVRQADIDDLLSRLRAVAADDALILTSFHQSPLPTALLLRLAGVARTGADSTDHPGRLLDVRHRRLPGRHEAEAALDTALAMGFTPRPGDDGRLRVLPPPTPPPSPATAPTSSSTPAPAHRRAPGAPNGAPRPSPCSPTRDTGWSSRADPTRAS